MAHRKGIIRCSCTNALCRAQAIQWVKCNFTRFSTNFRFANFSWMLPLENAVEGHMLTTGM